MPSSPSWSAGRRGRDGQIPFTERAKHVLEQALREALAIGHNYIGTEHILLGLTREPTGVGARILLALGVDGKAIRQATIALLAGQGSGSVPHPAPCRRGAPRSVCAP